MFVILVASVFLLHMHMCFKSLFYKYINMCNYKYILWMDKYIFIKLNYTVYMSQLVALFHSLLYYDHISV